MENTQNTNNQDNKSDLREKDFHEIVMKQYELINSQFNTIRQMQIDQEERDAEFDLSRLVPGFLRKKKNDNEDTKTEGKKHDVVRFLQTCFEFSLLSIAKNVPIILVFTILGLVYGVVYFINSEKIFESTMRFSSGVLSNSFYEGSIKDLHFTAINAPAYLSKKLNISEDDALKIRNIAYKEYHGYVSTKKRQVNDSVIESYEYYPFFEVQLFVTDNSVLDTVEKSLIEYFDNNPYIGDKLASLSAGIRSQLKDCDMQMQNMDSIFQASINHLNKNSEKQYFIKETGLDSRGLILNQSEPVGGIINSILLEYKNVSAQKSLLVEQLADVDRDKFQIVETHSVSNNPVSPRFRHIVIYTFIGFIFGFIIVLIKIVFTKLRDRVQELEKTTK